MTITRQGIVLISRSLIGCTLISRALIGYALIGYALISRAKTGVQRRPYFPHL